MSELSKINGVKLLSYQNDEGDFDYDKYKNIQEKGNLDYLDSVWVIEDNIKFLSDYLSEKYKQKISFGICHGTRNGKEQEWFKKYLKADVLGTEISKSAQQFPDTIQWDFHEIKDEWINSVDFIYSNALDHSYNPEECLNTWIKCLKPGGFCILEHSHLHSPAGVTELDPFGATIEIMPFLIAKWGKDNFFLRELVDAPVKNPTLEYLYFLVIQKSIN
ncbi:methyltransferase domain-containing protein [Aliarcobacter skirrowii]|uniref:methyltransferase domain-containing protein n=1 Tax=Aliarcobacter skirrowii TaxID=28200 RepID=UPI0008242134|nr:methyltransferase domain-containing protein [Aliarcobacter skirrowii]